MVSIGFALLVVFGCFISCLILAKLFYSRQKNRSSRKDQEITLSKFRIAKRKIEQQEFEEDERTGESEPSLKVPEKSKFRQKSVLLKK